MISTISTGDHHLRGGSCFGPTGFSSGWPGNDGGVANNKIYVGMQIHDDDTVSITFERIPIDHVGELLRRLGTDDIRDRFVEYVEGGHRQRFNAVWDAKLKE